MSAIGTWRASFILRKMTGVWAITSYFNPVGFKRRLSNYRIFRANLAAPLVTVELSFDGRFELADGDADILIQLSGGAVLWQKERLLNLAVKAVPPEIGKIAWLDCDLILKRPDWIDAAKRQLDELNVIQLFSDVIRIKSDDYEKQPDRCHGYRSAPGIAGLSDARELLLAGSNVTNKQKYHTGFAWAAKRRLLEDHGFYDAAIVGGGDSLTVAAMYDRFQIIKRYRLNAARRQHYLRWAIPFQKSVAGRVGNISGTICHLDHGTIQNRGYVDRQLRLSGFDFDPDRDLTIGANGAWQWGRPRPELEDFLRRYFVSRAEDE